ncbi:MAG: DMT family transporter [Anaerolineae bacterium]|nr:DMT family transporter [Anaerolineae bacterium]
MSKVQAITHSISPWRNQIMLLIAVFAGAWAPIFGRIAQKEHIPTTVIIAFRLVVGALVFTPIVLNYYKPELRKLTRRQILFGAGAGIWMAIHLILGFTSLEHTSVLVSSVLGGTSPIWIALIEVRILKVRMSHLVWFGLMATFTGGLIIALSSTGDFSLGDNPGLGIFLSIISAFAGAIYIILGRQSRNGIPFLPYLWMVFTFGAIFTMIVVVATGAPVIGYSSEGYFALTMLILLPQLIGHTIFNYVLRSLSATYVSVVGQLGVIMAAILAFFLFQEIPAALQLPGSIAIIIGITLVNLGQTKSD